MTDKLVTIREGGSRIKNILNGLLLANYENDAKDVAELCDKCQRHANAI